MLWYGGRKIKQKSDMLLKKLTETTKIKEKAIAMQMAH